MLNQFNKLIYILYKHARSFYGLTATIYLEENGVRIKPGIVGSIIGKGNFLSEKLIAYSAISGVEITKSFPILNNGYIQIDTYSSESGNKPGLKSGDAVDKNIVRFGWLQNKDFELLAQELIARVKRQ